MILAKYKYGVNTFLVLCYLIQNIVDNAIRLMHNIGRDRALNTKTEGRNNLMKKRISLALTVLLVLSVCVLPFATHAAENTVAPQALTPDQCKQQGHPLTSTEIQGNVVYVSAGTAQHRKTVHYSRRCHCGLRIEQYTKPDIYEAHTIRESVSGHNNGKHTVTRYCPLCAYSTSYTYDCPGGKNCISPTSIHEPY